MKVLAINGSARKNGNTAILLNTVLDELKKEGIRTELLQMAGKPIQGCRACYKCFKKKDFQCAVDKDFLNDWLAKMREADGILLGSPTYFSDVTSGMRAFIERCGFVARANDYMLKRKVGAAVVAVRRAGAIPAFSSMNLFLSYMQMVMPGSSYWHIGIRPGDRRCEKGRGRHPDDEDPGREHGLAPEEAERGLSGRDRRKLPPLVIRLPPVSAEHLGGSGSSRGMDPVGPIWARRRGRKGIRCRFCKGGRR
jgi:multimeric flavodoxin WrbA